MKNPAENLPSEVMALMNHSLQRKRTTAEVELMKTEQRHKKSQERLNNGLLSKVTAEKALAEQNLLAGRAQAAYGSSEYAKKMEYVSGTTKAISPIIGGAAGGLVGGMLRRAPLNATLTKSRGTAQYGKPMHRKSNYRKFRWKNTNYKTY